MLWLLAGGALAGEEDFTLRHMELLSSSSGLYDVERLPVAARFRTWASLNATWLGMEIRKLPCGADEGEVCAAAARLNTTGRSYTPLFAEPTLAFRDNCGQLDGWRSVATRCALGDSIGNRISRYWGFRAAAMAVGARFVVVRSCPQHAVDGAGARSTSFDILRLLPDVAPPPKASWGGDIQRCRGSHRARWLAPFLPPLLKELRRALERERRERFDDAAIDDVAVHVRAGDVVAGSSKNYGLWRVPSLDAYLPQNGTIGVVTNRFSCGACEPCASPRDKKCCDCASRRLVDLVVAEITALRPNATVSLRDDDTSLDSWIRLASARRLSVCAPSTFCLWPTMAADRGLISGAFAGGGGLFPAAPDMRRAIGGFDIAPGDTYVSFHAIALSANGRVAVLSQRGGFCSPTRLEASLLRHGVVSEAAATRLPPAHHPPCSGVRNNHPGGRQAS